MREILLNQVKEGSNSNSEVVSDENWRPVSENLSVNKAIEIGKSGNGTVVYEGFYGGRSVAVKRLLRSHLKVNHDEINLLRESHHHPNIVMYYGHEVDRDFVYLVMELCACDLDDLIQMSSAEKFESVEKDDDDQEDGMEKDEYVIVKKKPIVDTKPVDVYPDDRSEKLRSILGDVKLWEESNGRPSPLLLKLMRDMINGLVHLHDLDIIHRDLKPHNILISKETSNLCAKLSDMGLSRLLENKSTLSNNNTNCGTSGWTAPEKLTGGRQKREMDMFSLGCVLFYCVTRGWHPFGDDDERDRNIRDKYIKNLNLIQDFPEAFDLIPSLLENELEKRPKADKVSCHPLFWDSEKRLPFLSDTIDQVSKNSVLSKALEDTAHTVLGTKRILGIKTVLGWNNKVDNKIYVKGEYDFSRVSNLLRLIQYMFNNHEQLPQDIQKLVRPSYEGIDDYFTSRFPKLLIQVYKVVDKYCKEEKHFSKYFTVAN